MQSKNVIVFCAYRAPGGNLDYFLEQLDCILNWLDNPKTEYIICGDLNINFIGNNNKKIKVENLLNTYNLIGTVSFPTRVTNSSYSAMDNIFVDRKNNYTIRPHINGLSDHDAQLITLKDLFQTVDTAQPIIIRNINKSSIAEFLNLLSVELWEDVFSNNDVNVMFKNFLNMYIRCYNACFLKIYTTNSKLVCCEWLTRGIKISCKWKKELYVLCKIINNYNLKQYYKKYCKILTNVIRKAKNLYYNNIILRSKNKIKTTWKIINSENGKTIQDMTIPQIKLNDKLIHNQNKIANVFNSYFLSVAEANNGIRNGDGNLNVNNPIAIYLSITKNPLIR